jgi:hypothetical protein
MSNCFFSKAAVSSCDRVCPARRSIISLTFSRPFLNVQAFRIPAKERHVHSQITSLSALSRMYFGSADALQTFVLNQSFNFDRRGSRKRECCTIRRTSSSKKIDEEARRSSSGTRDIDVGYCPSEDLRMEPAIGTRAEDDRCKSCSDSEKRTALLDRVRVGIALIVVGSLRPSSSVPEGWNFVET